MKEQPWSVNLLQVSYLTFDPCSKVKWGHHTKNLYISLIIGSRAFKYETTSRKSWPANLVQVSNLTLNLA